MKFRMINIYIYIVIILFMTGTEIYVRGLGSGYLPLIARNLIAVFFISGSLLTTFAHIVYKRKLPFWIGLISVIILNSLIIQTIGIISIYLSLETFKITTRLIVMTLIGNLVALISFTLFHHRRLKYEKLLNKFKEKNH